MIPRDAPEFDFVPQRAGKAQRKARRGVANPDISIISHPHRGDGTVIADAEASRAIVKVSEIIRKTRPEALFVGAGGVFAENSKRIVQVDVASGIREIASQGEGGTIDGYVAAG